MMRAYGYTYCLMSWIASSYFIPLSIRARATSTGALCAWINTHIVIFVESDVCVKIMKAYLYHCIFSIKNNQVATVLSHVTLSKRADYKSLVLEMSVPLNIQQKGIGFMAETWNHEADISPQVTLFGPHVHTCLSPPQSSHTVDGHTASWILLKLLLQQTQPIVDQLAGGRGSIIKWPILRNESGTLIAPLCLFTTQRLKSKLSIISFYILKMATNWSPLLMIDTCVCVCV